MPIHCYVFWPLPTDVQWNMNFLKIMNEDFNTFILNSSNIIVDAMRASCL